MIVQHSLVVMLVHVLMESTTTLVTALGLASLGYHVRKTLMNVILRTNPVILLILPSALIMMDFINVFVSKDLMARIVMKI